MQKVDIKILKELALSATAGPWHVVGKPWGNGTAINTAEDPHAGTWICDCESMDSWDADEDEEERPIYRNADFIAAANPKTVLALIARAEAAEAKLAAIRAMATRSVPHMLNLAAIDRILDEKPKPQLTPQELAEFDKTGGLPEDKPHHIPCGECGACHANEPCARLA